MNPFFEIETQNSVHSDTFLLQDLGEQLPYITIGGRRRSDYWGTEGSDSKTFYKPVSAEDYDNQFVNKIIKWKPIYDLEKLLNHHHAYFLLKNKHGSDEFLKHMQYVILPKLKKINNSDIHAELFEKWLMQKSRKINNMSDFKITNNTFNVGSILSPTQFQVDSNNSTLIQNNHYQKSEVLETFQLLKKDLESLDEKIREDFRMEMDYAVLQLQKNQDIQPQLFNIGKLIKEIGIGIFANLISSPISDSIKLYFGLS